VRDLERLGRTLADDVSWHTPGANVLAGDYYGRAAVIDYLRQVLVLSEGTQQVVPVDLLVGRDHLAAVVDVSSAAASCCATGQSSCWRSGTGRS